jgi:hypothetical protein
MFQRCYVVLGFAILTLAGLSAQSNAASLNPAFFSGNVYLVINNNAFNQSQPSPGVISGALSDAGASLSGSYISTANPSQHATVKVDASSTSFTPGGQAGGFTSYNFEVLAPAIQTVPIILSAQGGATASGQGILPELESILLIDRGIGQFGANSFSSTPYNWSVNQTFQFNTNTIYTVELSTFATITELPGKSGTVSAWVDPTFSLDPSVSNPSQFSLIFSPGITNVSVVPLPSTWGMMLMGLVGLGFVAFRQKCMAGLAGTFERNNTKDDPRPVGWDQANQSIGQRSMLHLRKGMPKPSFSTIPFVSRVANAAQ